MVDGVERRLPFLRHLDAHLQRLHLQRLRLEARDLPQGEADDVEGDKERHEHDDNDDRVRNGLVDPLVLPEVDRREDAKEERHRRAEVRRLLRR